MHSLDTKRSDLLISNHRNLHLGVFELVNLICTLPQTAFLWIQAFTRYSSCFFFYKQQKHLVSWSQTVLEDTAIGKILIIFLHQVVSEKSCNQPLSRSLLWYLTHDTIVSSMYPWQGVPARVARTCMSWWAACLTQITFRWSQYMYTFKPFFHVWLHGQKLYILYLRF